MNNKARYTVFPGECCNYNLGKNWSVPVHNREVFNPETCETIKLDYSGHSLLRAFDTTDREYSFDYLAEMVTAAFDDLLECSCGVDIVLTNTSYSFDIRGRLYLSDIEDTYVFSIFTVVNKLTKPDRTINIKMRQDNLIGKKVIVANVDQLGATEDVRTIIEDEEITEE